MLKENKKELNDKQIEKVSGGYIYKDPTKHFQYQVRDDAYGCVKGRFTNLEDAQKSAEENGDSTKLLSLTDLQKLRIDALGSDLPYENNAKG